MVQFMEDLRKKINDEFQALNTLFLHLNCLWFGYFPMPLATNQYFWDTESPKYESHEGQFLLDPNKWKNWASLKHKTNVGKINLR